MNNLSKLLDSTSSPLSPQQSNSLMPQLDDNATTQSNNTDASILDSEQAESVMQDEIAAISVDPGKLTPPEPKSDASSIPVEAAISKPETASTSNSSIVIVDIDADIDADIVADSEVEAVNSANSLPEVSKVAVDDKATPVATKTNWISKSVGLARRHAIVSIACVVGLLVGSTVATWLRPSVKPTDSEVVSTPPRVDKKIVYVDAHHRHEPIQALVPFDDLNPAIVELGRRLFHEPGLSKTGRMSCATCHSLTQGGTLPTPLSVGVNGEATQYNAPTVLNAALNCAQDWDGSVATLEEQIDEPITSPNELGSSWERVIKFLSQDHYYQGAFAKLLEGEPTPERVRTALATFERSLITVNSKFDQWLAGTENALNSDEFGGYYLFKKFNCITCHQGAGVGGTMFQPLGVAAPYYSGESSEANLGRFHVTEHERDRHVFRVPQLRNVALTAPYFHDGSVATLEEAVALMIEYQCGEEFSPEDVRRLTSFLKTLTGDLPQSARN